MHHPEYNSTLILRSEVVADYADSDALQPSVPGLEGFTPIRTIHRRLLPRRPGRDAALDQHCTFYASSSPSTHDTADAPPSPISVLVLTPLLQPGVQLPYFHPLVSHLAFRLLPASSSSPASLRIEAHPLPASSIPTDPGSRLHRTALALLETLHRYAWGAHTQYRKRVAHDTLVPRDIYQDLYLVMRERWKHVVGEWREATDPIKHVFEVSGRACARAIYCRWSCWELTRLRRTSGSPRFSYSSGKTRTRMRTVETNTDLKTRRPSHGSAGHALPAASSTWGAHSLSIRSSAGPTPTLTTLTHCLLRPAFR